MIFVYLKTIQGGFYADPNIDSAVVTFIVLAEYFRITNVTHFMYVIDYFHIDYCRFDAILSFPCILKEVCYVFSFIRMC